MAKGEDFLGKTHTEPIQTCDICMTLLFGKAWRLMKQEKHVQNDPAVRENAGKTLENDDPHWTNEEKNAIIIKSKSMLGLPVIRDAIKSLQNDPVVSENTEETPIEKELAEINRRFWKWYMKIMREAIDKAMLDVFIKKPGE